MSRKSFFPYKEAGEALTLKISSQNIELPTSSDGSLLVYEANENDISFAADVGVPLQILNEMYAVHESESPQWETLLVIRSVTSRTRRAERLGSDGFMKYEWKWSKSEMFGEVELQALAVLRDDLPAESASPSYRGQVIAWSPKKRVLFDPPQLPPGAYLETLWVVFSEHQNRWLQSHSDSFFAIDVSSERPRVLLNEGIPGFRPLLESKGSTGSRARGRDATFFLVAHQVWSSLLGDMIFDLRSRVQGEDRALDVEDLDEWENRILLDWAPFLFQGLAAEDALQVLLDKISEGYSKEILVTRLPNAIQERFLTHKGPVGFITDAGA